MLEIKNITKSYKDKKVLSEVSFNVESGSVCGLLGLNGAGKSTLMKIICSMVFEDSGTVAIDGQEIISGRNGRAAVGGVSIGFMIEAPAFYPNLTGRQNLLALASLYDNLDDKGVDRVLLLTGMYDHANTTVRKYSLGMKQRLYFAYALINKPKVLILDEPFNGIDPVTVKLFRDLIIDLAKSGCAVLVSSHMIADIKTFCNKAVIIDKGVIKYDGTIEPDTDLESLFIATVGTSGAAQ